MFNASLRNPETKKIQQLNIVSDERTNKISNKNINIIVSPKQSAKDIATEIVLKIWDVFKKNPKEKIEITKINNLVLGSNKFYDELEACEIMEKSINRIIINNRLVRKKHY